MSNEKTSLIAKLYEQFGESSKLERILEIVNEPISPKFPRTLKLITLLNLGITAFNKVVFEFLKNTDYPLAYAYSFPLIENEDVLVRDDIFRILGDSGVGVPRYYEKMEFEVDAKKGEYARSRSGCFFCFFQQKIEWIWLYEQHPDLFEKAMEYEKEGYTWINDERLEDLIKPERIKKIKEDQLKKLANNQNRKSPYLLDILEDAEGDGCAICFI